MLSILSNKLADWRKAPAAGTVPGVGHLRRAWAVFQTMAGEKVRVVWSRIAHAADVWRAALADEKGRPADK
ncbi:MAG: hypothetical protein ACR2PM_21085, partial [Hyphomicrobiales bacterium]